MKNFLKRAKLIIAVVITMISLTFGTIATVQYSRLNYDYKELQQTVEVLETNNEQLEKDKADLEEKVATNEKTIEDLNDQIKKLKK